MARKSFGLVPFKWTPKCEPVAIKLVWHRSRDKDPAHIFLRAQLAAASREVIARG